MVPISTISQILDEYPAGAHDGLIMDALIKETKKEPYAAIRHASQGIEAQILLVSNDVFKIAMMPTWLERYPILWIPRQRFILDAVRRGPVRIVVMSQGFRDLLRLMSESFILEMLLDRSLELDQLPAAQRETTSAELNQVVMLLFAAQMAPTGSVPLSHVISLMPKELAAAYYAIDMATRVFAYLHEVGHFELGHLDYWRAPKTWFGWLFNRQPLIVEEELNPSQRREHEADLFAARRFDASRSGANGALIFFTLLGIVQTLNRDNNKTHPHPANRAEHVRRLLGLPADGTSARFDNLINLASQLGANKWTFAQNLTFNDERVAYPEASREFLAGRWLYNLGCKLIADYQQRPDAYKAAGFFIRR